MKSVRELITRLDQPAFPGTQFHVFHLRHTDVASAYTTLQTAFPTTNVAGLSPYIRVTEDLRTNSLIVQAGQRDLAEVADLIQKIDVTGLEDGKGIRNVVRIIQLQHNQAQTIVTVIQQAILPRCRPRA